MGCLFSLDHERPVAVDAKDLMAHAAIMEPWGPTRMALQSAQGVDNTDVNTKREGFSFSSTRVGNWHAAGGGIVFLKEPAGRITAGMRGGGMGHGRHPATECHTQ